MDEKLKKALGNIKMPQSMHQRILEKCTTEREEKTMKRSFHKRPLAVVTLIALCVCIVGMSALAATGKLQGFLRDLKSWDGAIIGQVYEQATDEIAMTATADDEGVQLTVTLLEPDRVPYRELDYLGLSKYTLTDAEGTEYNEPLLIEAPEIVDGYVKISLVETGEVQGKQVQIMIPRELPAGDYHLTVTELSGSKKADQNLIIKGLWECTFSVIND